MVLTYTKLGYRTSRLDLLNPKSDYNSLWVEYINEFGEDDDAVVVVEGANREQIVPVLQEISSVLAHDDRLFHAVLHGVDISKIRSKGLHYLSADELRKWTPRARMEGVNRERTRNGAQPAVARTVVVPCGAVTTTGGLTNTGTVNASAGAINGAISNTNMFNINVSAGKNLPAVTNIIGGSAVKDTLAANWATDFNGVLNLLRFATSTVTVGNNFNGVMTDTNPGYVLSITICGSLTALGVLHVFSTSDPANPTTPTGLIGDIGTMTVGGSIAGLVQVSGNITTLSVGPANTPTTGGVNDVSGQVKVGGALATVAAGALAAGAAV